MLSAAVILFGTYSTFWDTRTANVWIPDLNISINIYKCTLDYAFRNLIAFLENFEILDTNRDFQIERFYVYFALNFTEMP